MLSRFDFKTGCSETNWKTRMQVVRPTPQAVYTGITHAVSRIASTEGALTMWRGMTSVVLGAGLRLPLTMRLADLSRTCACSVLFNIRGLQAAFRRKYGSWTSPVCHWYNFHFCVLLIISCCRSLCSGDKRSFHEPFRRYISLHEVANSSHQTTNASTWKSFPISFQMCRLRLPDRRSPRLLHLLPNNINDECPLQRTTIVFTANFRASNSLATNPSPKS